MPQHFTDGFKRDTMRKRDLGGVGMASAVKDELPFNSANGGNTFQRPVEFVVAVHRQQFSFRGHIPVLVEDEQRYVEQRHFIVDFRLLAGGLDPYLTVLGHFQILRRQAAHGNRKYISLKAPGMERYIRLRSLGKNYSEEEIRGQILQPKVKRVYQKAVQIHPKKKLTGIQALYYSYLYQMGVLPKRPKRSPYAVREDIRKLDRRIEQIEFLLKHDIITREQLAAYREPLQKQIAELMKERRRLYRNGGRETGEERLSEINEELKRLRKEVRMTVQIEKHSLEIEAKLQKAEEQSQNEKRVEDKERMQKSQEVR